MVVTYGATGRRRVGRDRNGLWEISGIRWPRTFRLEAPTECPYQGKYQDQEAGPQPARLAERKPSVGSLRWFGSYKKSEWKVGWDGRREAYASSTGRRYRIVRFDDSFAVSFHPPFQCPDEPWEDIGIAATQEEAIALAQAHNDNA